MEISSTKKDTRDIILILSVAHGAAVAAVSAIHPAKFTAAICSVDPIEYSEMSVHLQLMNRLHNHFVHYLILY